MEITLGASRRVMTRYRVEPGGGGDGRVVAEWGNG